MADDKKLDRIENKLDAIALRVNNVDITLAAQHESLKDHIRRTEILEEEIKPIKAHVDGLKGIIKALKIISILAIIAEAVRLFWH